MKGVQIILGALRPGVVALIGSAGVSILVLALFQSEAKDIVLSNFHWIECVIFLISLFLLRKYKVSAIWIILGSGAAGMLFYRFIL